ncbi:MAG TPA: hypothetical protein VIE68_03200 [Gemmatimonadota bacterium]
MRNALTALVLASLALGCQPPPADVKEELAPADTTPIVRQRATSIDAFDGCYYQGQRFSIGAVKIQDGVLKKCVEEGIWHSVDGFGNLIPEDPSVQDTLSPADTTATTATG